MTTANVTVFVKNEIAELVKNFIEEDHIPLIEGLHSNEVGTSIYVGDVGYDYYTDILEDLKNRKIEAEIIVSDCSDTSIEDFTVDVRNIDGVMTESLVTKSGSRVIQELKECLEKLNNGATIEELKQYLEDKIEKTC